MDFGHNKLSLGPETHPISTELYSLNRKRLVERIKPILVNPNAVIVLQGGIEIPIYDSDVCYTFRQEPYFMWAFGVSAPSCYGAIEVTNGVSHLFIPKVSKNYGVWKERLFTPDDFKQKYNVDNVAYENEIADVLKALRPSLLLILKTVNTDSGLSNKRLYFEGIENFVVNDEILYLEMAELRVVKTSFEIDVMRYVTDVASAAHRKAMKIAKPGKMEYQCEAEFLHYIYSIGGCRQVPFPSMCASGPNTAILHYDTNDRLIRNGDMMLLDMGANYFGYSADISCSFPANGKFTADQKLIYETALRANLAVARELKPGVSWRCMHLLAVRVLLSGLKDGGLLRGDIPDMVMAGLGKIFMPHGIGHFIGLDCHDVGGYMPNQPERPLDLPGLSKLRTARVMKKGMVITIQSGCYFINYLLDKALNDENLLQFIIPETLKRFRSFGGVRIEDVVVITEGGIKNLVSVPRTVEEIENWLSHK